MIPQNRLFLIYFVCLSLCFISCGGSGTNTNQIISTPTQSQSTSTTSSTTSSTPSSIPSSDISESCGTSCSAGDPISNGPNNWTARNATCECINNAIQNAASGDTINVPSGSATWNSTLTITKGINLIGAGSSSTIITTTAHPGIAYTPAIGAADNPFRLSGFKFNKATGDNLPILQWGTKDNAPTAIGNNKLTKGRVDHCIFNATSTVSPLVWLYPGNYGVFDNNTFNAYDYAFRATDDTDGSAGWKYWGWTPGTSDAVYIENNTFNFAASVDNVGTSSQGSHRWVFRYNTFNVKSSSYSFFDAHGNYNPYYASVQISNLYGNKFVAGNRTGQIHGQRGGQSFVFYNDWQTTGDTPNFKVQEEYADSTGPGPANNAVTGQPQHVYNSYYFNNRLNTTGDLIDTDITDNVGAIPSDNVDVWSQSDWRSNGSAGVGCGTLAQMNAITPTIKGVGFWVTNQSCTNVSSYVGANPATPISGTLYRWNGSAWVSYYTPYTYPHPLRN